MIRHRIYRRSAALIALIVLCLGVSGGPVTAAGRHINGVTISPAFQQIVVDTSKPSETFDFAVTNNTAGPLEFSLSTVDFGSLDESGGVLFMGNADKSLNYKYGLSQYVTLGQDRIVVEPKKTTTIPVTIENKDSLAPGGHYGAVLVTPTGVDGRPSKVEVNQVMSSLLFVTKKGGEIYDLSLHDYDVKTHLFTAPSSVDLRFQNAGNVHVVPRGVAIVTDPAGKVVKKGFINTGSGIVLPETFRKLSIPLDSVATAWRPGRYHMSIAYRYDGSDAIQTRDISFIYINGWYIVGFLGLLALIALGVFSKRFRRVVRGIFRPFARSFSRLFRSHRRAA